MRAGLGKGDPAALDHAVAIRKLFDGKPLVSGVKALLAHIHGDPALARVKPPLAAFSGRRPGAVIAGYDGCAASAWPDGPAARFATNQALGTRCPAMLAFA